MAKSFKQFMIESDSYTIHQHTKSGEVSIWGGNHSLESAKKEAIDSTSHALGSKHGHEFSVKNSKGETVHHFKYEKRPHNGGAVVWDKQTGKIHKEL
jgi:hypothetical protein